MKTLVIRHHIHPPQHHRRVTAEELSSEIFEIKMVLLDLVHHSEALVQDPVKEILMVHMGAGMMCLHHPITNINVDSNKSNENHSNKSNGSSFRLFA